MSIERSAARKAHRAEVRAWKLDRLMERTKQFWKPSPVVFPRKRTKS